MGASVFIRPRLLKPVNEPGDPGWFVFSLEGDHGDGSAPALSSLHLDPSICCLRSRW